MEKKNYQLPTKEEVLGIINKYKEHKRQWQSQLYRRYDEEKANLQTGVVAENTQPYGEA